MVRKNTAPIGAVFPSSSKKSQIYDVIVNQSAFLVWQSNTNVGDNAQKPGLTKSVRPGCF